MIIRKPLASKLFGLILFFGLPVAGIAQEVHAPSYPAHQDPVLSPDLLNLLRQEMLEITAGIQGIALALVTADWKTIQDTGKKIRESYIMEKKLTPDQKQELEQALPERFRELDSQLHQRAEKLEAAAKTPDPELVVFQYSRLVENCTICHSLYARTRFPGFTSIPQRDLHQ